jgi:hypothetical protein
MDQMDVPIEHDNDFEHLLSHAIERYLSVLKELVEL